MNHKFVIELTDESESYHKTVERLNREIGIESYEDCVKAELEEIKAEIDNIRDVEVKDGIIYVSEDKLIELLDNHINQADCNNDCEHCEWTECPKD